MKMTDEEIWKYLPLAYKLATKFCNKRELSWEYYEDSRQEAAIALIRAGRKYDHNREHKLKLGAFLAMCILRRLSDWLKRKKKHHIDAEQFEESRCPIKHGMDVSHGIHKFELASAMRRLDWMDRDILHRSYGFFNDPETQDEIAKDYKVRRQSISLRQRKAERKLREMLA